MTSGALSVAGRVLGLLISTTTVVALFYFFGYIYSQSFYGALGINVDRLGMSTADLVTRSSHVMIGAFAVLAVVLVVGAVAHLGIRAASRRRGGRAGWPLVAAAAVVFAGIAIVVLPAALGVGGGGGQAWWPAGILLALYGCWLVWVVRGSEGPIAGAWSALRPREATAVGAVLLLGSFGLVTFAAFEWARASAQETGRARAAWVESNCEAYPSVRVYSTVDLHLEQPGVSTASLPGKAGDFLYRYDGLRMLNSRNGLHLVWPLTASPLGAVFGLPDDDRVRVEPGEPSTGPCPRSEPT